MPTAASKHEIDDCRPLREAVARGEVTMFALARGSYPGTPLKRGQLPGLMSLGSWNAVGPQTWGLPMHRNEGIEICCLLSGEVAFATNQDAVLLRSGDITITRPWQQHRLGDPVIRACHLFWMILDVETGSRRGDWELPDWVGPDAATRRAMLALFRRNQRCHFPEDGGRLRTAVIPALESLHEAGPLRLARVAALVNDVLLHVTGILSGSIPHHHNDPHGYHQTIRTFFRGLEGDADAAAEPLTVAAMARACRVGVTHMTAVCRDIFNTTPAEHLARIRLGHAARMLAESPSATVTEIAFRAGFNSSQYFATRFRRQYGLSPGEFRRARGRATGAS
jgi:AraC-like DNA-binding protein